MALAVREMLSQERGAQSLETWRCPRCSRILAKLRLAPGSQVEVKCGSCNAFSTRETALPDRSTS